MTTNRREVLLAASSALAAASLGRVGAAAPGALRLSYIVGSSMYGRMKVETIVAEVRKTGAAFLDVWPAVHGNQREQVEQMGHERFAALLKKHNVRLGMLTQYPLGPLRLQKEMKVLAKFGIGRATSDAAHEIREKHITREEGVALVHRYDHVFPDRYLKEFLEYVDMTEEEYLDVIDAYREKRPNLWEKVNGEWKLKHRVS